MFKLFLFLLSYAAKLSREKAISILGILRFMLNLLSQDSEGKIPFYWGTAADGSLAFSDTREALMQGCGKSFAPFPSGKCVRACS